MCYVGTIAQAFEKTWKLACEKEDGVMLIPPGKTFLISSMEFKGSCKGNITFQVKHFHNILHIGNLVGLYYGMADYNPLYLYVYHAPGSN